MECKETQKGIKAIYLIKPSDYIRDTNGNYIRMKRKQKGFDREVIKLNNDSLYI